MATETGNWNRIEYLQLFETQVFGFLPRRELARGLEYGTDHRVTSKKSVLGRSSPSASSRYDQSSEAKAEIDPEARAGEPEVRATSRSKCPGAVRTERRDGAEGTAPSTEQPARTKL